MKRFTFLFGAILFAFIAISQPGAEAVEPTFAERFIADNKGGDSGAYTFDRAHSAIGFKVKHNGLIEIPGFFRDFAGTVNYDAKDVSRSTVEFTAKVTSVDTGNTGRDNHLRSPEFFEVAKYPDITFKSTKIAKKGKSWLVTGDFTMKGVTKSITFPFNIVGWMPATERSGARMGIMASASLNRRDYGINYGSNLPSGIPVISDVVNIEFAIEAPMRRETPAATPKPAE
ncbi:MAG: YceI family protein [Pyrinomonadaceae bacterium]